MILNIPACCLLGIFALSTITLNLVFANSLTNETDYQSLLSFKNNILSDPLNIFQSWNDSVPFCSWTGVTCGKKHHRVSELRLPSLQLSGSLSSHIWNLSFLRVLNLDTNRFKGILPQEIGRLLRLEFLNLANNSFDGELPKNLTHCKSLSILTLLGNNLQGQIPTDLGSLPLLTRLFLGKNRFTGKIPRSLGNLSALTHLSLDFNDIHGDIPSELGQLPNLSNLQLTSNKLSGPIPPSLFNLSSLMSFSVVQNNLSGGLPNDMFLTLPNLRGLYIGNNSFSGPIPTTISNASNLVEIDLTMNLFAGSIPVHWGSFNKLQLLNFGLNQLGTENGDDLRFITSLTNYTKLHKLGMQRNVLKGSLPSSIGNLSTTLEMLRINGNFISGTIPEGIGNLVNLDLLLLNNNELTGTIPDSVGKLSELSVFHIAGNNIYGRIPSSIGNLTIVTILSLRDNMLEGTIPASIGNCRRLNGLDLAMNHLGGQVPVEIFALPSLTVGLMLDRNNLVGPLSSQVGRLANLGMLYLSGNNMYGEIPATLGNCLVLEALSFQGNNFTGSIPSSLKNLRGLRVLDLSQNNLSGPIPSFLAELPLLEYLNLSFNMFEGEVPNGGIFNNLSAVSLVGNHKLCGGPSIWELPPCTQRDEKRQLHWSIMVAISAAASFSVLCVCVVVVFFYRSRKSRQQQTSTPSLTENDEYPLWPKKEDQYSRLSYRDLFQATDGFSSSNVLGEGSFGVVYRGVLRNMNMDQVIAVKVLKLDKGGGSKSFMAECEALRNIRHRNLVKTMTSCSSTDFHGNEFKALVFEFMPNGNLDKWLHPIASSTETAGEGSNCESPRLSLLQRLNITIDVAAALNYLHHLCHVPIVHCDLKSSNVLLDGDMSARLSDFGLAKFLLAEESQPYSHNSSIGIRGTVGYIAPEYGLGGAVSTKADVYSFGILLLEIFIGKRPTESMFVDDFQLRKFVARAFPEGLKEVVDPSLLNWEKEPNPKIYETIFYKSLHLILQLGVACSATLPSERMDIGEAVVELYKARDLLLGGTRN